MLKGNDLVRAPVIVAESGETIEEAKDIILSLERDRVMGFLIERGGWGGWARVLPWQQVVSVTPQAIFATADDVIISAYNEPELQHILEADRRLRGAQMFTADGVDLGMVTDLFFDADTGAIEGYEVCGQMPTESTPYCVFVPIVYHAEVRGRTAWVPPVVADVIREQISTFSELTLNQERSQVSTLPQTGELRESKLISLAEKTKGRHILWDVRSDDGHLIAARGQVITDGLIERAAAHDRILQLIRAAGPDRLNGNDDDHRRI